MPILYAENGCTFTLHTQTSTYQMAVEPHGYLLHCYYGEKIEGQDLSYLIQPQDRGFAANPPDANGDRTLSPDTLPQEYSTFGVGDFRESCLDVQDASGAIAADLRYCGHRVLPGKPGLPGLPAAYGTEREAETLEIDLRDAVTGLTVTLQYSVFADFDVITRSARIANAGPQPLMLRRALSLCLDWQLPAQGERAHPFGKAAGIGSGQTIPRRKRSGLPGSGLDECRSGFASAARKLHGMAGRTGNDLEEIHSVGAHP